MTVTNESLDPAATAMSAPAAGLLRRLVSMVYDTLLVVAIWMLATALLLPLTGGEAIEGIWLPLFQLYIVALTFGFFALFWMRGGQTLGMKSWNIYLERADGGTITLRDAALRFLAGVLTLLPAGIGLLWCLVDGEGRALHDRLSGTRVVYRPRTKLR